MMDEFYRMCDAFGWRGYGDGGKEAKILFKHILAQEFGKVDRDVQELEDRQSLKETSEPIASSFAISKKSIATTVTNAQGLEEVNRTTSTRTQCRARSLESGAQGIQGSYETPEERLAHSFAALSTSTVPIATAAHEVSCISSFYNLCKALIILQTPVVRDPIPSSSNDDSEPCRIIF